MDDSFKLHGPFDFDLKVYLTDGENIAVATLGSHSQYPDKKEVRRLVLGAVEQMPEGWRLCTKEEYWDALMAEKTGTDTRFAPPGGDDWDFDEGTAS